MRRRSLPLLHMLPLLYLVPFALALAGCGGLLKRPEVHTYSVEPMPATGATAAVAGPPIGIGTVELPPGFDRQDIVVRASGHRLEVRGHELWPAPLASVVRHTLAVDLAARLPTGMVVLPGQTQPAGGTRSLDLVFAEIAAGPDNALVLDVRWSLSASGSGAAVTMRQAHVAEELASLDSAAIAGGMSRALATLADRIAGELAPP